MVTGCKTQRKRHASHWCVLSEKIGTIHSVSGVISIYVSVLRQINGTRASQYLSLINFWACWNSSGFMKPEEFQHAQKLIKDKYWLARVPFIWRNTDTYIEITPETE